MWDRLLASHLHDNIRVQFKEIDSLYNVTTKYSFHGVGKDLLGSELRLQLRWHVTPWSGLHTSGICAESPPFYLQKK